MSENQPTARMLDFSNVGVPSSFGNVNTNEMPPPSSPATEESKEQDIVRRRVDDDTPSFTLGRNVVPIRAHRRRFLPAVASPSPAVAEQNSDNDRIRVSMRTGRYFVLNRSRSHTEFNPVTIDEFYKTQCASGCVRIYQQLLPKVSEEMGLSADLIRTSLAVDLPFSRFKDYISTLTSPYQQFKQFKETDESKKFAASCAINSNEANKPYLVYKQLWDKFVQIRYQMRRLLTSWLIKKAGRKILPIPNYETMEEPDLSNCVQWIDIENRCTYTIHGDTLLKSIKMYLHHSEYGFPEPLTPKNPNTNSPFTLGQMIHLTYELYTWCGKNRKAVPYILTKYQEAQFSLTKLVLKNRPEMTLYACRDLFKEMAQPDAIEMWLDMIEEYGVMFPSLSRDDLEIEMPLWIESLDTNQYSTELSNWASILPDLVQLSRFRYFTRVEWTDISTVKRIVKGLWTKTYHKIRLYVQSKRKAILEAAEVTRQAAENFASQVLETEQQIVPLTNSTIQQFIASLALPAADAFEVSSVWTNAADQTSIAEMEYNVMMFANLIPDSLLLPALIITDETASSENSNNSIHNVD